MSVSSRSRLRTFAVAAMTFGLLAGTAGLASATGSKEDPRAEITPGNATTCADAGLAGTLLEKGVDFTFVKGGQEDQFVTIETVAAGVTVSGIVVKGGPAYNIYVPGERGLAVTPPWEKLRSPLNRGGNIPVISHWYVCGDKTPTTTTTTTDTETTETTTEPPQPSEGTETTESTETSDTTTSESTTGSEPTTSESGPATRTSGIDGAVTTTTTSAAAVSPAGESDDLASTGFSGAWLLGLGALLLVGGGALLFLTRMRRSKA
ncbi:hypothetical protein ABZ863_06645 [Saccharomonospora sp. NPDC046836]|uniref:hypothetical protein n=1 Tax=Saccharomonospora sp. NPDC046836 TaxID=3156921 RepID=UPI0033EBB942